MRSGLAWLLATACATGVDVRLTPTGMIDLDVKAAPLSAVLECLAQQTGIKYVAERGAMPRQQLTLSLRDRTEVQTIYGLLEGLGLNYAMSTDPSGTRVQMLLLSTSGGTGSPRPVTAPPPPEPEPTSPSVEQPLTPVTEESQLQPQPPTPNPGYPFPQTRPGQPLWPGGPPAPDALRPPGELFPEQRPLSPLSLRDGGRVKSASR